MTPVKDRERGLTNILGMGVVGDTTIVEGRH